MDQHSQSQHEADTLERKAREMHAVIVDTMGAVLRAPDVHEQVLQLLIELRDFPVSNDTLAAMILHRLANYIEGLEYVHPS